MIAGGVDTGWTFYTPYSTTYSNSWVIATALGIFIAGFSSILTGLNFIVTVHRMRAPGMTWFRMPLFVWANYATSLILVLGHPGTGRHHRAALRGAGLPPRHFRSRARRRPGALPAPLLVLLAPRRLHHGAAVHGCGQRTHQHLFAQGRFRLRLRGVLQRGHCGSRLPGLGPPHVRQRQSRCMPAWSSAS